MIKQFHLSGQKLNTFLKQYQNHFSYVYASFLVFVTPLSIPLAWWTWKNNLVTSKEIIMAIVFFCISGLGITLGYHRLVTHRSYQTKPWLKRLLLIAGSFAMQGGPAAWASLHIQHHRYADKPGDPHSPKVLGFWRAHCGWVFKDYKPNFRRFGKWLLQDNEVKHVSKYYPYYSNLGLLLPCLLAGWVGFVWAGLLRLFFSCHLTWAINSVCHQWGTRFYPKTKDNSTNHFLIALFTFGEGWHNNHHRFLQSAYFGHRWYQLDMGQWVLMALKKMGLVWDVKIPKELIDTN